MAFVETKGSFVLFSPMFYLIIQERECKISFNNNDEMIPLVLDFFSFLFFFYRKFLSYLASPMNFNFNYNETYICI